MKDALPLRPLGRILLAGTFASFVSGLVLFWRSRRDTGRTATAVNAPSHWVWGPEAVAAEEMNLRHTLLGTAVHWLSGLFWAAGYEALRRRGETPARMVRDAAVVTGLAAVTDLALVPERLTPGFEHRLSRRSLGVVYASFAAGLAAVALLTRTR